MKSLLSKRFWAIAVSICVATLPLMQPANAAIISTEQAIQLSDRQDRIDHINSVLSGESVQSALIRFGVDPADASARVGAMTDAELLMLENQLAELPAGGTGFVEVVGIVAIVLIVLELLDVTNFFTSF